MTTAQAFALGSVLGFAVALLLLITVASLILAGRSDRDHMSDRPWPQEGDRLQSGRVEYVFRQGAWQPSGAVRSS